jgi:hypothetical protein
MSLPVKCRTNLWQGHRQVRHPFADGAADRVGDGRNGRHDRHLALRAARNTASRICLHRPRGRRAVHPHATGPRGDVYFRGSLIGACLIARIPIAIVYNFCVDRFVAGFTMGAIR